MKIYKIMADAHREAGDTDMHKLKALDFLATCDEEDIRALFNSGAFNQIITSIVEIATNDMPKNEKEEIMRRMMEAVDTFADSNESVL